MSRSNANAVKDYQQLLDGKVPRTARIYGFAKRSALNDSILEFRIGF